MSLPRQHWLGALLALAVSACAPSASETDFGFGGPSDQRAIIAVDNQYFGEMIIYVLDGASRTRLGTVTALSTANLSVPRELIGMNVQLQANPLSPGTGFTSRPLLISPGSRVSLRLANDLAFSDLLVH